MFKLVLTMCHALFQMLENIDSLNILISYCEVDAILILIYSRGKVPRDGMTPQRLPSYSVAELIPSGPLISVRPNDSL